LVQSLDSFDNSRGILLCLSGISRLRDLFTEKQVYKPHNLHPNSHSPYHSMILFMQNLFLSWRLILNMFLLLFIISSFMLLLVYICSEKSVMEK